jgi:uncharacterized membrane protein YdcZ (DUF606 family)
MKVTHLRQGRFIWYLRHEWFLFVGGFIAGFVLASSCALLSELMTR